MSYEKELNPLANQHEELKRAQSFQDELSKRPIETERRDQQTKIELQTEALHSMHKAEEMQRAPLKALERLYKASADMVASDMQMTSHAATEREFKDAMIKARELLGINGIVVSPLDD